MNIKKAGFLLILIFTMFGVSAARNRFITKMCTAAPSARVFNDTLYVCSSRADYLYNNEDGTTREIIPTNEGIQSIQIK